MLILTRTPGESIMIGDNADIQITILNVSGKQVRLGIQAPRNLPVHREEIYLRIHQPNETATDEKTGN